MSISDKLCEELRRLARATPMSMLAGVDRRSAVAMESAADRIELLESAIRRLADQDATLSVQGGNVIVEMDATLSDAEREAVELATDFLEDEFYGCSDKCKAEHSAVATLRRLLARLHT